MSVEENYMSRNFATLGPSSLTAAVWSLRSGWRRSKVESKVPGLAVYPVERVDGTGKVEVKNEI